ncbi:hypothetical protein BaRGS_00038698 [Batillaria attramentaria]|uniref:Uncharacterized protein n=1 Tax=Batillaria attramentaria TaxID=370345 RepID=A0ABD0J556_9CAEN
MTSNQHLHAYATQLMMTSLSLSLTQDVKECAGNHVCTTLMRYPDGYTADEGPNCRCRHDQQICTPDKWEEDRPESTLTWQHYERSHWLVQYKFCSPIYTDQRMCNTQDGERAAVITTDVKSWQPHLDVARCRCPDNLFQLMGWKREGNLWKYFYNCHKPECRPGLLTTAPTRNSDRLPCSKIYIDPYKSSDKVLEVSFLCACPEGQMCPGRLHKKTEDGDLETESDEQGTFVYKYCENTKLSRQTA